MPASSQSSNLKEGEAAVQIRSDLTEIIALLTGHTLPSQMDDSLWRRIADCIRNLVYLYEFATDERHVIQDPIQSPQVTLRTHQGYDLLATVDEQPHQPRSQMS